MAPSTTSAVHNRSNASRLPNEHDKRPQVHQTTAARGPPREMSDTWVTQVSRARQAAGPARAPRPTVSLSCCEFESAPLPDRRGWAAGNLRRLVARPPVHGGSAVACWCVSSERRALKVSGHCADRAPKAPLLLLCTRGVDVQAWLVSFSLLGLPSGWRTHL